MVGLCPFCEIKKALRMGRLFIASSLRSFACAQDDAGIRMKMVLEKSSLDNRNHHKQLNLVEEEQGCVLF